MIDESEVELVKNAIQHCFFETPSYLLNLDGIQSAFEKFKIALNAYFTNSEIAYSYKTNANSAVTALILRNEGSADVVTGAELYQALEDGFAPKKIIFNGPNKNINDLAFCIENGVRINADSLEEVCAIVKIATQLICRPVVGLRLQGKYKNRTSRFGLTLPDVAIAIKVLEKAGFCPSGIHLHIGSNLPGPMPILMALQPFIPIVQEMSANQDDFYIDLGGGMPARSSSADVEPFPPDLFFKTLHAFLLQSFSNNKYKLIVEPGRYLVEDHGYYIARIKNIKQNGSKKFLSVDGGSNHVRSALTWFHPVFSLPSRNSCTESFEIYGANCFESDLLGTNIQLPMDIEIGDFIVLGSSGGYDMQCAFAWNRSLPAVFLQYESEIQLGRICGARSGLRRYEVPQKAKQIPMKVIVDKDISLAISMPVNAPTIHETVLENSDFLSRWLPWVKYSKNEFSTRVFLEEELEKFHGTRGVTYAIWYQGVFAGHLSCHEFDWSNRATSLGYWLAEKFINQGIMTRAVRSLIEVLFNDLDMARIEIRCGENNIRSKLVAERTGFMLEGISKKRELIHGSLANLAVYSRFSDE